MAKLLPIIAAQRSEIRDALQDIYYPTTVLIVFPTIAITQRFPLLPSSAVQNGMALRELAFFFLSFADLHHPSRRLDRFHYGVTAFDHVSKLRFARHTQTFNKERRTGDGVVTVNVIPGIIYTTDDVKS
ncbi:hypothetical protein G5I_00107 [Acromyrmex echinatior]|uniref:Uncharacterized protein n=1 Tax=Acromyrmex echinatior TaxID=103372 RepID=F4W403_ACREC|nr:hypothetical protein G5I_00107 [Acromyrmex echinatior]